MRTTDSEGKEFLLAEYMNGDIKRMPVYEYAHIDWFHFLIVDYPSLLDMAGNHDDVQYSDPVNGIEAWVKDRLRQCGWEGDGELGLIWVPPFLCRDGHGCAGEFIWHVKQNNNGTSYLLCHKPLHKLFGLELDGLRMCRR